MGLGALAIVRLPREEEPQIVAPMVDVFVRMPRASAKEVEERLTKPMEPLLWEIPGVEYVYSTSSPGQSVAIVRFLVGQDEERSLVRLQDKLASHADIIPPGATPPLVKLRSIDDVPVLALTLWSPRYYGYQLRRLGTELQEAIKQVPDVSEVTVIGGERRQVRVVLDPARLAGRGLSPMAVAGALQAANLRLASGAFARDNREFLLETGAAEGHAVFLADVAEILDGPEELSTYVAYPL